MGILLYILGAIFAFGVGILLGMNVSDTIDGLFIVDDSDDKRTKWILDVNIDPDTIPNKKEIHLKVKKMDDEVV